MGAQLSRSSQARQQNYGECLADDKKSSDPTSSIIDLIKLDCLRTSAESGKRRELHHKDERVEKVVVKRATLEEWLLASPASISIKREVMNGSEIAVVKQSSAKVSPWRGSPSAVEAQCHLTSRTSGSFCLEKPKKAEADGIHHDHGLGPSLSRRGSGSRKRKSVSFRLPEESDIIIFWSPVDDGVERV